MNMKAIKLLLWAIFMLLLSICIRVLFIGYVRPNLIEWICFALPVVSVILAICSWIVGYISDEK